MYSKVKKVQKKQTRRGFTIAEVLLASFVMTMGLTVTTALIVSSTKSSYNTREVIVAAELAQEGIELIRNVRDTNLAIEADGGDGGEGFLGFDEAREHCKMDANDTSFDCQPARVGSPAAGDYCLNAPVNPASGHRFLESTILRQFCRYIYIDYDDAGKNARVVSYVFWRHTGGGWPSAVPNNGNTNNCTIANRCVFSEVKLTRWSQ